MSDIHASVGIVQMNKLEDILERRRKLAKRYDNELSSLDWLITPAELSGYVHAYQSYVCLFNLGNVVQGQKMSKLKQANKRRNELMERLAQRGIATAPGTQAIHTVSYYKQKYGFDEADFPNTLIAEALSIALPIYPCISDEEQKYVIDNIKDLG